MWELSFTWGKMRTAAGETEAQIALRDCSKEVAGESQYLRFWWRGNSMQSSAYFTKDFLLVTRSWRHHEGIECISRYEEIQGLGSWNQFLKISNHVKTCFTSFPGAQSASLSTLYPPHRALKVSSCSSAGFSLCRGRRQMPLLLVSGWQILLASASL